MITGECTLYCYKKLKYFDHIFSEGKYYNVIKTAYTLGESKKEYFTMIDDNGKNTDFDIGSNFESKTLSLFFYTKNQHRKEKIKNLSK